MHKAPVRLIKDQQAEIGAVLVNELLKRKIELLTIAVKADHVHGLGRFERNEKEKILGLAKARSSHALREQIPGTLWAKRANFKPIKDRAHQLRSFNYVADHKVEGAWVWTFRDQVP